MPVGATTTTLRSVSAMNRRISVDLPVPALPVRNRCLPPASSASACRNSSVRTISLSAGAPGADPTGQTLPSGASLTAFQRGPVPLACVGGDVIGALQELEQHGVGVVGLPYSGVRQREFTKPFVERRRGR